MIPLRNRPGRTLVDAAGYAWVAVWVDPRGLQMRQALGERYRRSGPVTAPLPIRAAEQPFPIEAIMRRYGYNPFIPTESHWIRQTRYHAGWRVRLRRAIIPGLVFLHLEEPVDWPRLLRVPMVASPFKLAGEIVRFPAEGIADLERISDRVQARDYHKGLRPGVEIDPGDAVMVDVGPLTGLQARAVEIMGEKSRVMATFFGSEREVELDNATLRRAT